MQRGFTDLSRTSPTAQFPPGWLPAVNPRGAPIILDIAREQQRVVMQQANELDAKATGLLGFAGLLLGLLFSSDLAADHWNSFFTVGAILLGAALIPLGGTLYPRVLDSNPGLDRLMGRDTARQPTEIERLVALSLWRSIRAGSRLVRMKSLLVRASSILIAAAVALIAGRLVYVLEASVDPCDFRRSSAELTYTYSHHD
jgi:hypothetical protein